MSNLHYFQRYSKQENVVTNNTLLLLSRLYSHSPLYLETFLGDLLEMEGIEIGVGFTQQDSSSRRSVPDGLLVQRSLRVVIETKVDTGARLDQLEKHLEAFGGEETQILLLLTPTEPGRDFQERLNEAVRRYNEGHQPDVQHFCTTFRQVIRSFRNTLAAHNHEMLDLLGDYEDFCATFDKGQLLPRDDYTMRAVPCGKTIEDNREFRIYYQPVDRPYRPHKYVGIYKGKRVQYIGEIEATVDAVRMEDGSWLDKNGGSLPPKHQYRIENAASQARKQHGWDITTDRRFFLVKSFHPTDFRKESPGGMVNHRYFDLGEILDAEELPNIEEIAKRLSEKTW